MLMISVPSRKSREAYLRQVLMARKVAAAADPKNSGLIMAGLRDRAIGARP